MPIDDCTHTFEALAANVLPAYYALLEAAIQAPHAASTFVGPKGATKALLKELDHANDFPGCYVFIDGDKPVYVGISRSVVKRIVQHLNFDSHNTANLVYRKASKLFFELPDRQDQPRPTRAALMANAEFLGHFKDAQQRLRNMKVAYVQIDNDLELYLFEVYAAMKLDTDIWNTFRTH